MALGYKYYIPAFISILLVWNSPTIGNEIEITEKLGEYIPNDILLINEQGDTVNLLEEITIPTVISFVYFNCPGICTPLLNETQSIIEKSNLELGTDYQFFAISFDPRDTPALALQKKNNYIKSMQKKTEARSGWKFFTSDSLNIQKVTSSLGFGFKKVGTEYIHKASMIFVNADGMIIRYNMGINLLPSELQISVIEANKGNTLPKTYKNDEYCFPYVAPAYQRLNNIAKAFGIVIIASALLFFFYLIIKPKFSKN
jgi:protein SCO1/2